MTEPTNLDALIAKLAARDRLSAEDRAILTEMPDGIRRHGSREILVRENERLSHSLVLLDGFVCRYRDMADGQRIILELHVPGDFIDLQGFLLKRLEHDLATIGPVVLAQVPHGRLEELTEDQPRLARMLWFTTLVEAAIHRQWIVSNGRRSAIARVAHLFCELQTRLEVAGIPAAHSFALPLVQSDIADATGLTAIHVNRMLRRLRDDGALTYRDGIATVHDRAMLMRIAEFDPGYLFLERDRI